MNTRTFTRTVGWVMLIIGVFALIPQFSTLPDWLPNLKLETSYGLFINLFPMNIINKLALLAFGVAGIWVSQPRNPIELNIRYSKTLFVVMAIAALLGIYRPLNTLLGYWPLFGADIWLHTVFAGLGAYFGYREKVKKPVRI